MGNLKIMSVRALIIAAALLCAVLHQSDAVPLRMEQELQELSTEQDRELSDLNSVGLGVPSSDAKEHSHHGKSTHSAKHEASHKAAAKKPQVSCANAGADNCHPDNCLCKSAAANDHKDHVASKGHAHKHGHDDMGESMGESAEISRSELPQLIEDIEPPADELAAALSEYGPK